ncbi:MAG: 50S ribosomal protein L5 [Candidatus Levybacteria bacterium RIFCSPLOWO2_01_FULL_38_13]|nr:MAG: 50S ribosomal protein L5 [Candidatus Levybacteria bacterium RIFCSPHIGHO2_01_FULL_41_15]OGH34882.1 MAG: 50S ribosomal protein L5 [Candidatus Levybacteria bacterium RIFCSPLOWO2_01_FULL_38_13]
MQTGNINTADLRKKIREEVSLKLQKDFGIKNPMVVPMLSKIVINVGVKNATVDKKNIGVVSNALSAITGQKPKVTKARKSIASFKLREGDKIGLMVTLRGKRMYDFFEKLVNIVLPRLRDFHGVKLTSFDEKGNYTLGFTEFSIFPEIDIGKMDPSLIGQGMEVSIATTAKKKEEGFELLSALGTPFRKDRI